MSNFVECVRFLVKNSDGMGFAKGLMSDSLEQSINNEVLSALEAVDRSLSGEFSCQVEKAKYFLGFLEMDVKLSSKTLMVVAQQKKSKADFIKAGENFLDAFMALPNTSRSIINSMCTICDAGREMPPIEQVLKIITIAEGYKPVKHDVGDRANVTPGEIGHNLEQWLKIEKAHIWGLLSACGVVSEKNSLYKSMNRISDKSPNKA